MVKTKNTAMNDTPFLNALNGHTTPVPPIWFMRQAGRYLPEYRAVRKDAGSFLNLCFDPDRASEVTLQPIERFDLDAAILFADILLIPYAMGQNLTFLDGEGPQLSPIITPENIDRFLKRDDLSALSPIYETVRRVRAALPAHKALIGFAGAPWTVATYMLNGGASRAPGSLRSWAYRDRGFLMSLLDRLCDHTINYLIAQIEAGADAVQLFDSWAGDLPWPILDLVSVRPITKIARAIKKAHPHVPVIFFPRGVGEKAAEYVQFPECSAFGIDYAMDPAWARAHLSDHTTVQGGLDPLSVITGGDGMRKAASSYLKLFHDVPYVFNLGHGFSPETPPENVQSLVDFVRSGDWR